MNTKHKIVHPKFTYFMRKILTTLAVVVALSTAAWAQPSINIPTETVDQGDNICLEITVDDFTDILTMSYTMQWDPTVLEFTGVQAFGLPLLNAGNFDASMADEGILTLDWEVMACDAPAAIGVVLPDGATIYELCFTVPDEVPYGSTSDICIVESPVPINVTRENTGCLNIGIVNDSDCGLVSVGVEPFIITASNETGFPGDLVCVDFMVTGFNDLTSMQFSMNWDCDQLAFQNVIPSENLVNLAASSFGNPSCDALTVSWSYFDPDDPGVDLPDSTVIFQACFMIVGDCGMNAPIIFSSTPTEMEVTNVVVEGFELTTISTDGNVYTGDCDPEGLQFVADCGGPANINDNICVEIQVGDNFDDVSEFSYLMEWNPTILRFSGVNDLGNLPGLNDFDDAGALTNGVLGVAWDNSPLPCQSLSSGTPIFEVCFDVIGIGGNSPFNFITAGAVGEFCDGTDMGIAPSNCAVEVIQPEGVAMSITNGEAAAGDTTCLDLVVSNFDNITSYQFSLSWEPNHMVFTGIENIDLPEATMGDFILGGASSGSLSFDWEPSTDYSLPDNSTIFQVCFEPGAMAEPDDCDVISVVDLPIEAEAVNTSSNGNNIGIISQDGEYCVLFPEGFGLDAGEVEGFRLDTVCVPFYVTSFDNIVSADFTLNFNPAAMELVDINLPGTWPGLIEGDFDQTSADVGVVDVSWTNIAAPPIADSTVVFELCFALADTIDCFPINISDSPEPVVETLNGTGSLVRADGELCINDRFIIEDIIITPASCPEVCDGAVELIVTGGTGTVGTTWMQGNTTLFTPFVAEGLCPGPVKFTLFDNASPSLILMDTIEIPVSENQPFATIVPDTVTLGCNPASALLNGMSPDGEQYSVQWSTCGGAPLPMTNSIVVNNINCYVFRVTDDTTGCVARDTVEVIAPETPTADAGPTQVWTCANDTLALDGTASEVDGVSFLWRPIDDGNIVEGDETLAEPRVTAPGNYELIVTINATGCSAADTVLVEDGSISPDAVAGPDMVVNCGDESVLLDGTGSSNDGLIVTYRWFNSSMELLGEGETLEVSPPQLGEIVLVVEEFSSGCTSSDTLEILPDDNLPVVSAGEDLQIDCTTDLVTITGSVMPDTIDFVFSWNVLSGDPLVAGTENSLMPQAEGAGEYELVVTNTANNCMAADTVIVTVDTIPPVAEAGEGFTLTCAENCYVLDGTGSTVGDSIQYIWRDSADLVIAMDTLMVEICDPGTYYLEVLNTVSGCSSIDSVEIAIDGIQPQIIADITQTITCENDTLTLDVSVMPSDGNYTFSWALADPPLEGNIIGPTDMLQVQVDQPGTYQLTVTDLETGCVGMNEIVVEADTVSPTIAVIATNDLNCDNDLVTLDGTGSSAGPDFTYEWSALEGQTAPDPGDALMTDVMEAGWYAFVVTDTTNGCSALDSVQVMVDTLAPVITIAEPDTINCQTECVMLDASASDGGADFSVTWTGLDGGTPDPADALTTEVCEGGRYELLLRNNISGCESRDTIEVATDNETPTIVFAEPDSVTCETNTVELDATQSTVNGDFTTSWEALGDNEVTVGADPLTATATGAGDVQLTITLSNGCESVDTVTVASNAETPVADAGGAIDIECGGTAQVGGSNTSTGDNFTYTWAVIEGNITGPTDEAMTTVDEPGSYELTVSNGSNGCSATDTAFVTLNLDNLEEAMIDPPGASQCEDSTMLAANLPDGITGLWTTTSTASIETPDQAMTFVQGLQEGANMFVWTLSAPGCENYSADSVSVMVEGAPTIVSDNILTLDENSTSALINLLSTVNLGSVTDYSLEITSEPVLGTLDTLVDGEVTYTLNPGVSEGEDVFTFEICNTACPDLCATAQVIITIEPREAEEIPVANGITPNGDGLNDALVFDDLINEPEKFKNNEIVIFNRWGDIVYEAKPYLNDWQGTNMDGGELPHGTYYYILRLDIANGDIIRGDVTIIKKE